MTQGEREIRNAGGLSTPLDIVRKYSTHSSGFLGLNEQNSQYLGRCTLGVIAYRPYGRRHWIQFGGPVCAREDAEGLQREFFNFARERGKRIVCVQVPAEMAPIFDSFGKAVANQFGCAYSIDLDKYNLKGRKHVKNRNMISRARREGVTVSELSIGDQLRRNDELNDVDTEWLRHKGRHVKEMTLLIGSRGDYLQPHRRLFVAEHLGEVVAYVSYSPAYGTESGWLYDLTRRRPGSPPGVIEAVFDHAASKFRSEGSKWLHLGLTPFVDVIAEHEMSSSSAVLTRIVKVLGSKGEFIYPAQTQRSFKMKWRPDRVVPEYVVFPEGVRLSDIWCLARSTNAI